MKIKLIIIAFCVLAMGSRAQTLTDSLAYRVETQLTLSNGNTPLWLHSNRYGLSSLQQNNGHLRVAVERPLQADTAHRVAVGYGLDVALAFRHTSTVIVQQAFVQARWLKGTLTVGSKEQPMQLRNRQLSLGTQTVGINARPVPQVSVALDDYYTLPFRGHWLHIKGHVAYGMFTDDGWQHTFTQRQTPYTDRLLFHHKAGYLKIGNTERFPLTAQLGLEMAAQFGGTTHLPVDGQMTTIRNNHGLKAFLNAFVPGGADVNETTYQNAEGNQLGTWTARVDYHHRLWQLGVYAEHFFEDHSSMFLLDYDGYGSGNDWDRRVDNRYFLYPPKDMMLGLELNLHRCRWLRGLVAEYVYTKYQSGPVYHDHTPLVNTHLGGRDNYYNHFLYGAWQHWGQTMGLPLYLSPIYNDDHRIHVADNRFVAWHVGANGKLSKALSYRILCTWQQGYGTYDEPYRRARHTTSVLAEAVWRPLPQWTFVGAYGHDRGTLLGHRYGFQITVRKEGLLCGK